MLNYKEPLGGLRDTFLQLPLPTRVIGCGLVAVIAIGLWMLAGGSGRGSTSERLFIGDSLTDDEITKILAAFSSARLNGWEIKYNHVYVPTSQRDEYLRAVQEAGSLPLRSESLIGAAQQQASPLDSDSRRRAVEDHAKERELGRRIAEFPQILRATVMHDSLKRGFSREHRQSASVIVTPIGNDPLPPPMTRAIKELVRSSYAGMNAEDVTVTDVNARGQTSLDNGEDLFQERVQWEEYYTRKARQMLKPFGPLSIDATVEINPMMDVEQAKLAYDSQPTTLQEHAAQTNIDASRPLPGGVPGVAPNAYGNKPAQIDPAQMQTSKTVQKNESTIKVAGEQYERSRSAGFQPERLSFSIGVPENYYETAWRIDYARLNPDAKAGDQPPPMTAEDRARLKLATAEEIKRALTPMLMEVKPGEDSYPLVEVWDHRDLPELPSDPPSTTAQAMQWLASSWQTLGMFALAAVALLLVRGMSKIGAGGPRPDFHEGFGLEIPRPAPETYPVDGEEESPRLTITGQNLKQELTELVSSNPEAAANVLRHWLDSSAA